MMTGKARKCGAIINFAPHPSLQLMHYIKSLLIIVIWCLTVKSLAAQFAADLLPGTWKPVHYRQVSTTEFPDADNNQQMEQLFSKMLLASTFTFHADHSCVVKMPSDQAVPKGYWTYDSATAKINIMDYADRNKQQSSLLFGIQVRVEGEKIYWIMEETPVILEMQKVSRKIP